VFSILSEIAKVKLYLIKFDLFLIYKLNLDIGFNLYPLEPVFAVLSLILVLMSIYDFVKLNPSNI